MSRFVLGTLVRCSGGMGVSRLLNAAAASHLLLSSLLRIKSGVDDAVLHQAQQKLVCRIVIVLHESECSKFPAVDG